MEKDTKYFIGVVVILLIAIISFSFNNITGENIKDISGMAVITKESACNGACPSECAQHGVSCTSSSCSYVDSICYGICMSEPLRTPAYCNSKCAKTGTKYSCSYEETATVNNVALQSKGASCSCHLKEHDCGSTGYPYYPCANAIDGVIGGTGTWWYVPYTNAEDNYPINAWIKVNLASEVFADKIILKSIPVKESGYIKDGILTLYDNIGNIVEEKKNIIVPYRSNVEIPISNKKIKSAKFDVLHTWGKNAGIAEFEIYESSGPACSDTDNGINYYQKGTVIYTNSPDPQFEGSGTRTDTCHDNVSPSLPQCTGLNCGVTEFYCENNEIKFVLHKCGSGYKCIGGACVAETCEGLDETQCKEQNPKTDKFGCGSLTTSTSCNANANCEWFSALESSGFVTDTFGGGGATGDVVAVTGTGKKPCQPKTKCVWTNEHCCGDKEEWRGLICEKTSENLCFSFWPDNKEEGKGAKYTQKQVCWKIGSVAYGFWVPVSTY